MNGLGPAAGLGSLPPLALPLGAIAYVPAFIPIPQPVLTAIPNHSLQQYAQQVAAAQQGGAGQAGEGQQQPGQAPFMQVGLVWCKTGPGKGGWSAYLYAEQFLGSSKYIMGTA